MGMIVDVLKSVDRIDCSKNGVTNRYNKLCVVNVDGPFEPSDDAAAVELVEGNLPNTVKIVPVGEKGKWTLFGGNYAASSDSRFSEAIRTLIGGNWSGAVAVHDRVE